MLGSRFASMLFPEPGGPIIKILNPIITHSLFTVRQRFVQFDLRGG
jgi:hypothetical protein